ncbi:MAG: photosystem I assembly protein Ycf3 [Candidatus Methanofastidiosum methylothiophilum]|uniref:Photosystem I assembly protein Ycf3 n=1 Tax=Candidatus Methanofastidiosum methylothiophilum TaxID=1705564 RepID=A0A150J0U5_9EURY|nr:MAG: photosystem I assembly protein Ycf3 [Candidatus Methanofastidiosum methylthiophilus]KYC48164.1 MAG: photosystem I assembly protein Ycf3 [Candidatus Methanofastidiosum methylthiophilus]KYC50819.1 MAG: photosystem I assembly protein Ycf3 [Candidatus Methanofastidiosum methylthiophilus]
MAYMIEDNNKEENNILIEANKYLSEGNYEKAIKLYQQFIDNSLKKQKIMDVGMGYHNLGIVYDAQRKSDLAIDCFIKALEYHKKIDNYRGMSWAYFSIGLIFGQLNKYEEMFEQNKKALTFGIKVNDNEIVIKSYNGIGHALNQLKRYPDSLKYLEKALELFDSDNSYLISETYYLIGICLENLGRKNEAIESYSLAIDYGAKSGNEQIVALSFSKISEFQAH